jgi:hypothetical protein
LQRVGNTFTGGAANQGRINFALGSDPMFLANPAVFVIDQLSTSLTNAYNNAVVAGGPNNPAITIGANGAVIGLGRTQTAADLTPLQISKLPDAFVNGTGWPAVGYHVPPVVTVAAPASGTTATAVIDFAGVETPTFIPGIVALGTNGTAAVAAVTATAGTATLVVNNTTAGAQNVTFTVSANTATLGVTAANYAAAFTGPVGSGASAVYTLAIASGQTATITATGNVAANGVAPTTPSITVTNAAIANLTTTVTTAAGVTGVAGVTLAAGTLPGKIQAIRVVNGGSGYGRGNLYQRWFTTLGAGQNYIIWGAVGSTSATANINNANVAVSAFDGMTGVTFMRDIHYGTGTRVD